MPRDRKRHVYVLCTLLKSTPADFSSCVIVHNGLSLNHPLNKRNEARPIDIYPLRLGKVSVSFNGHSHSEKVHKIVVLIIQKEDCF